MTGWMWLWVRPPVHQRRRAGGPGGCGWRRLQLHPRLRHSDGSVHPRAQEICDGLDNNCDGDVDLCAVDAQVWYRDQDKDGFGDVSVGKPSCTQPEGYVANHVDCDDSMEELSLIQHWYADRDQDGYGTERDSRWACGQPEGYIARAGDCDDRKSELNPDAVEICPSTLQEVGRDEDCNGLSDDEDPGLLQEAPGTSIRTGTAGVTFRPPCRRGLPPGRGLQLDERRLR